MPINTPKQRQLQRERINRLKPWLKSTGPKTAEGKAIVSQNACGSNFNFNQLMNQYRELMREQKKLRNMINL